MKLDRQLEDLDVERAQHANSEFAIFDGAETSFGVRVRDGTKRFFVKGFTNGRQWKRFLGRFPAVSVAEARARARKAKGEADRGIDMRSGGQRVQLHFSEAGQLTRIDINAGVDPEHSRRAMSAVMARDAKKEAV